MLSVETQVLKSKADVIAKTWPSIQKGALCKTVLQSILFI